MRCVPFLALLAACAVDPPLQEADLAFSRAHELEQSSLPTDPGTTGTGGTAPAVEDQEIVLLWSVFSPGAPYAPRAEPVIGLVPDGFQLGALAVPPPEVTYPVEDPDLGVDIDPAAPRVAAAQIALVADGMLETELDGVIALDGDKVLGMVPELLLFYTPVELPTTDGVRWLDGHIPGPVTEGFHLYNVFTGEELPLDEVLTIALGDVWT